MGLILQGIHSLQLLSRHIVLAHCLCLQFKAMPSFKAFLPTTRFKNLLSASSCCPEAHKPLKQLIGLGKQLKGSYSPSPHPICSFSLLWWRFFVLFFNQSQNGDWPWWSARLQRTGRVWVESFLLTNCTARGCDWASMQLAYLAEQSSSDISCLKMTLRVGTWLWKRVYFSKCWSTLLSMCHSLHVLVCDRAHHTARKTSLTLWIPSGQAAAVSFDGEGGQCSHAVALSLHYWDLAVQNPSSYNLRPLQLMMSTPKLSMSVNSINHLVYLDYHESAGNSLSSRRNPTQNSMCKKPLLVCIWPYSCILVKVNVSSNT